MNRAQRRMIEKAKRNKKTVVGHYTTGNLVAQGQGRDERFQAKINPRSSRIKPE